MNTRLLNPPTPLKSVPLRIYIPSSPPDAGDATPGSFKVMQTLVPPRIANSSKYCQASSQHYCKPALIMAAPAPPKKKGPNRPSARP